MDDRAHRVNLGSIGSFAMRNDRAAHVEAVHRQLTAAPLPVTTIAGRAFLAVGTVRDILAELEAAGLAVRVQQGKRQRWRLPVAGGQ